MANDHRVRHSTARWASHHCPRHRVTCSHHKEPLQRQGSPRDSEHPFGRYSVAKSDAMASGAERNVLMAEASTSWAWSFMCQSKGLLVSTTLKIRAKRLSRL